MKNPLGKIAKEKDGYKVVFERVFNHPIEKVWDAITNPEELKFWFTDIELDFRPGGTIKFQFRDEGKTKSYGEVVAIEPPNRFVWTWEGELAVWELIALDQHTTQLVFTYSKLAADYAIKAPAGFHDLLDLLAERLDGSEEMYPFGAEDDEAGPLRTPIHYAASVYGTYPTLVKNQPVVVDKTIDKPIERVWGAITDKAQLKQWYFDLDDFKPEVGFHFSFAGQGHKGEQYIHQCTVTEVIPQKKLQYSWQYEGHRGYSLVTFELTEMGTQTKLILTHHGLETFPQDSADFTWKSFNGGWNEIIGKMLPDFLMKTANSPIVECQMMIRKPVATVFEAFIDPAVTTKFWFTKSSGKLAAGKTVTWQWEMYNVSSEVRVKEIVPNQKISIEWDNTPVTTVDFEFTARTADTTYVVIKNYGFNQTGAELIDAIKDNTGGFTTVLDGLKAWLEFGIELNLVKDKFPNTAYTN